MTAGASRNPAPTSHTLSDEAHDAYRPYPFAVSVRTKLGDDLEGLEAHGDGISFRSPRPLEGGQVVELVICRAILVEAEVVGCVPMPDRAEGHWVRARFRGTSPALNQLISEELNFVMTMAD